MNKQLIYFRNYMFCGLMAGIAEIIWAYFYTNSHMIDFSRVSIEITRSLFGAGINNMLFSTIAGVLIHIFLSIIIGAIYGLLVSNLKQPKYFSKNLLLYFYSIAMLVCIWWLAYFVLLPILNQNFIILAPPSSAIYSKLLFGITMTTFLLRSKN